ncbi:3-oxo-5-alpha-steroid 4-dehydrogenase 2 isoform 3-T3 [Sarcophilus harrisii]
MMWRQDVISAQDIYHIYQSGKVLGFLSGMLARPLFHQISTSQQLYHPEIILSFSGTFIYSLLTRGSPFPLKLLFPGLIFCTVNGFLQGHYLIYCAEYPDEWFTDVRFTSGIFLFFLGMTINIHSDYLLRHLRKPGETSYKIPQGGLFTYISGANYFGEIVEWIGYAMATWSLPGLAFAFFSLCFLGKRAREHHRFYLKKFQDYPKSRKAIIPFIF